MRTTLVLRGALAAGLCLLGAGCGDDTGLDPGADPGAGQAVAITQRAIAAVALDHAPADTTSRGATYTDDTDPPGLMGADLRYGGDGESDGDLLRVTVGPRTTGDLCAGYAEGCERGKVAGGTLYLVWEQEVPEEDPGFVVVVFQHGDEEVRAMTAGEVLTGDPRELDLTIPVVTLEEIAQDPRLTLLTSPEVVAAGDRLEGWRG